MNDTLRRMKPSHLRCLFLHWKGFTFTEISDIVGLAPTTVSHIVNSPEGAEILLGFKNATLDSMRSVDSELQAMAPALLTRKMELAFSTDEKISSTNCSELLAMAGHNPVRRIRVERTSEAHEQYAALSEDEIRDRLLAKVRGGGTPAKPERDPNGGLIQ